MCHNNNDLLHVVSVLLTVCFNFSGHESVYKVKTFQYKTNWPEYVFNDDSWQKLQDKSTSLTRRRSSLSATNVATNSWPLEEPLINTGSSDQELFLLSGEALKYVSRCDDLLSAVASVVCCDGSNSIKEHLFEDYFKPNTPTEDEECFCIINTDLEQYRIASLCDRHPVIARYAAINCGLWLVEHKRMCSLYDNPSKAKDEAVRDLLLLDSSARCCLLLSIHSSHSQKVILTKMFTLLEHKQWEHLSRFVCSFPCDELQLFDSNLRLLHDYCICCVLTVAMEDSTGGDTDIGSHKAWHLLLKICDTELKCRMLLGTLHHWDHDVCLQLLKACLEREHETSKKTALQKLVIQRLDEMQVYIKASTNCYHIRVV